ncbi:toxin-antitoxin system YwqK family antitoxin [Maribacter sp.]|nr:toxin-antitoxin system YwqK family antitoxin [Maribacter sp.]
MKRLFPIFLVLLSCAIFSCKKTLDTKNTVGKQIIIDSVEVSKKELVLNPIEGKWYHKNVPFNGFSVKFHLNGTLEERLGFYQGKRQGIATRWSENGVLRVASYYEQNRLTGMYKSWWENGVLGSEANYVDGKINGVEKKWYATGQLAKERQLVDGKEEGLQKAWLENGKLYVNYEAKNGRIFGMRRANSCYKLEDEIVVRSK